MSNMGVNDGHTIKGPGSGAVGKLVESVVTREVGNEVRKLFKERGHNAINCTIDYANSSSEALSLIVQQANRHDLDWFVSIHFNAGGGRGVEIYTYEGRQYKDAVDVCKNISDLGFPNRGVKKGNGLYVIRKTKAKSMLIEVCFVDTADADQYLQIGAKAIAKAIVDGILGIASTPVATQSTSIKEGEVTASILNVRSGPWTTYPIIGKLSKGQKVKIAKEANDWYDIYFGTNGGYVSKEYIKLI